jgi:hypothetical protein
MAVTDTLFIDFTPDSGLVVSAEDTVVLEMPCPDCGTALQMGTLDTRFTGGYSIPFIYCANQCSQRRCARLGS